jgi:hypothetical protein
MGATTMAMAAEASSPDLSVSASSASPPSWEPPRPPLRIGPPHLPAPTPPRPWQPMQLRQIPPPSPSPDQTTRG